MSNIRSIPGVATLVTCCFMKSRATQTVATQFRGIDSGVGSWKPVSRKAGSAWAIAMALMGFIHGTLGDGEILHSRTGLDWIRATTRPDVVLYGVVRWAGHWVAVGEKGAVNYSRDADH